MIKYIQNDEERMTTRGCQKLKIKQVLTTLGQINIAEHKEEKDDRVAIDTTQQNK